MPAPDPLARAPNQAARTEHPVASAPRQFAPATRRRAPLPGRFPPARSPFAPAKNHFGRAENHFALAANDFRRARKPVARVVSPYILLTESRLHISLYRGLGPLRGSFDLQLWPRIGTMNSVAQPSAAASAGGVSPPEHSPGGTPAQPAGRRPALPGSWKASFSFWTCLAPRNRREAFVVPALAGSRPAGRLKAGLQTSGSWGGTGGEELDRRQSPRLGIISPAALPSLALYAISPPARHPAQNRS